MTFCEILVSGNTFIFAPFFRVVPDVSRRLGADGHSFVFLVVSLQNLLHFRGLQQSHTGGQLRVTVICKTQDDTKHILYLNLHIHLQLVLRCPRPVLGFIFKAFIVIFTWSGLILDKIIFLYLPLLPNTNPFISSDCFKSYTSLGQKFSFGLGSNGPRHVYNTKAALFQILPFLWTLYSCLYSVPSTLTVWGLHNLLPLFDRGQFSP